MVEELIDLLGDDLELTAEEIADILWLASQWQQKRNIKKIDQASQKKQLENKWFKILASWINDLKNKYFKPTPLNTSPNQTQVYYRFPEKEKTYGVYPFPEKETTPTKSIPFPVPDAPAIPKPLTFVKAFRPLMREIASLTQQVLNEEATVNLVAETELLLPILEPAPEKWLQLDLVIDESSSSILWRRTIQELEGVFQHYGIFRDVRKWNMGLDEKNKPYLRSASRFHHLNELIDLQGRRLILIISDCVDPLWQKGYILPTLKAWTNHNPVVLLQMLPSWLWSRTSLGQGINAQLTRLSKPIANKNLQVYASSLWEQEQLETGIKLPLITFAPEKVEHWALMLVGEGEKLNLGYVLREDLIVERLGQTKADTALARIKAFKQNSSPQARQLAELLAAAPVIIMPVVRLIQNTFLETPMPEQVMEVFLGGLLEPVIPITSKSDSEQIQYQFKHGVREELVGTIDPQKVEKVIDRVSRYIANRLGKTLKEFVALLKASQDSDEPELVDAFARVTETILQQTLGYQRLSNLDNRQGINDDLLELEFNVKTIEIKTDTDKIELESFEFEADIATIVFEEEIIEDKEKLQQWTFETPTVNRKGEIIDTKTYTASFFTEILSENDPPQPPLKRGENESQPPLKRGENESQPPLKKGENESQLPLKKGENETVDLEMVAITGGTFVMGSPENEKSHRDKESPQHIVTVPDFFMGKYPVTQAQWKAIASRDDLKVKIDLKLDPSRFKEDPPQPPLKRGEKAKTRWDRPVETVNWYEAVEFCQRLSKLTGRDYQLPSEAQWEYACRAVNPLQEAVLVKGGLGGSSLSKAREQEAPPVKGREQEAPLFKGGLGGSEQSSVINEESTSVSSEESSIETEELIIEEWNQKYYQPFYFGETITGELANYNASRTYADEPKGEYRQETTPVGMFPPNAFGLYDMHGNVWEWCVDDWHSNYDGAPTDGSAWIDNNEGENINNPNKSYSDTNTTEESYVILRGGSWFSYPHYCRSAYRLNSLIARDSYNNGSGFRVSCVFGRTL